MSNHIKVLVVDDSPSVREILTEFLQEHYQVATASDGAEAIARHESFRPDIILLDMNMPNMGGLEVIDHLRQEAGDQDVYILVVTADTSFILKKEALNKGANDYLIKPYKPEELKARVGVAERQVRLSSQLRQAFESIDKEISLLADIQSRLLPTEQCLLGGVEIHTLFRPSGRASGDFFDYFQTGERVLRVAIADVSGHGARAAFLMGVVHTLLRTTEKNPLELGQTLQLMNSFLRGIIEEEPDYVSVFVADIDTVKQTMEYTNAGHCPPLLGYKDGTVTELTQTTHVLGFFETDPATRVVSLADASCLLLYTDGIYEWQNAGEEMFGLDGFLDLVKGTMADDPTCQGRTMDVLRDMSLQDNLRDDATALFIHLVQ